MRLYVYLLEGKELAEKDTYVKLKVGKSKSKTRVLMNTKNPVWKEEFVFKVDDLDKQKLVVSLHHFNEESAITGGIFNKLSGGDIIGHVKIPLCNIVDYEENNNLSPTWFSLEKHKGPWKSSTQKDCGKILIALSLHGKGEDILSSPTHPTNKLIDNSDSSDTDAVSAAKSEGKHLLKAITNRIDKLFKKQDETLQSSTTSTLSDDDISTTFSDINEDDTNNSSFEEMLDEMIQSVKRDENEGPENLQGGILLDMTYAIAPKDLNMLLFAPNSQFSKDLAEFQGTTDIDERPWTRKDPCLTRTVTYTKPPTKLVKAVKAIEEQRYVKASDDEFIVFVETTTPDVPYGNSFKVNLLYKMSLAEVPNIEEESTRLVISWAINFHQTTMMKSMIESGAKQGLKESFDQFTKLLADNVTVINPEKQVDKGSVVSTLEAEHRSNWDLGIKYFCNWTVISTVFTGLYVFLHILFYGEKEREPKGLEFYGVDLPDSFGQVITCGILAIQMQRVFNLTKHFVEAILQRGSDHGVKAQGEGWVLTVALVEGMNISLSSSPDASSTSSMPDPYVVMTCNGKSRTSSVKLQTANPEWNELLEFDASEEPPSVLDVEVFDFEGPFGKSTSLGSAEINFLKHTSSELGDMWVTLEGNIIAQSSQPKLHLRIFLDNTNGVDTIKEYLNKMEKEVGKKLNLRSPQSNSSFQKLFGLPPEEFLIKDFLCSLRRKMPLQGRLFLSARIVGFYTNLFGHKTKFYFLWEDIEDIHVLPPSLGSVGSPSLVIILHKDHGIDARHGAKAQDEEGRLHFYFHSFLSFNEASRTVLALWKSRNQPLDEKDQISEERDEDEKADSVEDTWPYVIAEDVKLSEVLSIKLALNIDKLMQIFDGGEMEHKIMSKLGCINYTTTSWQKANDDDDDLMERHISYKFNRFISVFGVEVNCTQQKTPMHHPNKDDGWIVNEIMTIHNVPFSDYFRVNMKFEIVGPKDSNDFCECSVYIGMKWLKNTKFEQRITKNIIWMFTRWYKKLLLLAEKEVTNTGANTSFQEDRLLYTTNGRANL